MEKGEVNNQGAREVFEHIFAEDVEPLMYAKAKGLRIAPADDGELEAAIDQMLAANQDSVEAYRNGKEKVFGFLVGQVMKEMKGKANPQEVNRILKEKLKP